MGKMVRLPWITISLAAMIGDVIANGSVTLTVTPRHDVRTRRWYSLHWTGADEQPHSAEGSELQLVLRRAAETEQIARMDSGWGDE